MNLTLRTKLIVSFTVVIAISGIVATIVGVRLIGDGIIRQAQDKVRTDLNSAREIYDKRLEKIEDIIRLTSARFFLKQSLSTNNAAIMSDELEKIRNIEGLDILTVTNRNGKVVFRTRNKTVNGDDQSENPMIKTVLTQKKNAASTEIISKSPNIS